MLDCCRCWSASFSGVAVYACLAAVAAVAGSLPLLFHVPRPPLSLWTPPFLRLLWCAPAIRLLRCPTGPLLLLLLLLLYTLPPSRLLPPLVAVVPRLAAAAVAAVVRPCYAAGAVPTPAADVASALLAGPTTPVMAR